VLALPKGTYLIISNGGYPAKAIVNGCTSVEGLEAAHVREGSVEYSPITRCEEATAEFINVSGEAFTAPVRGVEDLVLSAEGFATTPALPRLGRVRRFEHQHLTHLLGFALARSGGEGVEDVWGEYPGDAKRHAPIKLLERVGGVGAALWGVALGGSADVEEFVSGLALGMGSSGTRIRLDRDSAQALTLILRRGGVRHKVDGEEVVIRSVMDVLVPHREGWGVWREPIKVRASERVVLDAVLIETGSSSPLLAGYVGWYLLKQG